MPGAEVWEKADKARAAHNAAQAKADELREAAHEAEQAAIDSGVARPEPTAAELL